MLSMLFNLGMKLIEHPIVFGLGVAFGYLLPSDVKSLVQKAKDLAMQFKAKL